MSTRPISDLVEGDEVLLPSADGTVTFGPLTVEWVRTNDSGSVSVGWHARREDHELCLPTMLADLGAVVLHRAADHGVVSVPSPHADRALADTHSSEPTGCSCSRSGLLERQAS